MGGPDGGLPGFGGSALHIVVHYSHRGLHLGAKASSDLSKVTKLVGSGSDRSELTRTGKISRPSELWLPDGLL